MKTDLNFSMVVGSAVGVLNVIGLRGSHPSMGVTLGTYGLVTMATAVTVYAVLQMWNRRK